MKHFEICKFCKNFKDIAFKNIRNGSEKNQ